MGHDCSLSLFLKKILFIYLAVAGLSCSMWDPAPWPGIEPRPLHWEHGVLAIGPPGKSLNWILLANGNNNTIGHLSNSYLIPSVRLMHEAEPPKPGLWDKLEV